MAGGHELGRLSRRMARFAISTCGEAGLSVTANENCFFGEPAVLDRVLGEPVAARAEPGGPHREVCDGCACVGGNVISFARALRKGGRVTGIEFDATRCEFLKHNVATAGVPAEILRGDVAQERVVRGPDRLGDLVDVVAPARRAPLQGVADVELEKVDRAERRVGEEELPQDSV